MLHTPKYMKNRSVHSGRLERWLGAERIERLSKNMTSGGGEGQRWYGTPICLVDCPGSVWVTADGDFVGNFDRGFFHSAADAMRDHLRNLWKLAGKPIYVQSHRAAPQFGVGFPSLDAAILRSSSGFNQRLNGNITKIGPTGVANVSSTLWRLGPSPVAGSTPSAAPGGSPRTKADTGAMAFANPASGTLHLTGADMTASVINHTLLLYDRLFDVAKTINSTATEAVSGVPTRYQSTTSTDPDYVGGNFLFIEVGGTALAATAHNWTTCLYTNQAGSTGVTLPSVTGNSAAIVDRFDMPTFSWFCPLASGDVGIKALTQMQCSALVATGAVNFVIGHPIGWMCFPVISAALPFDWYTNREIAPRIFNDACLGLIEVTKPATTAATYTGQIYANNAAP